MKQTAGQLGLAGALRGCSSWQDIQEKWRNLPAQQKGDLFEELVKAYLQFDPEYGSKLRASQFRRRAQMRVSGTPAATHHHTLPNEPPGRHLKFWRASGTDSCPPVTHEEMNHTRRTGGHERLVRLA